MARTNLFVVLCSNPDFMQRTFFFNISWLSSQHAHAFSGWRKRYYIGFLYMRNDLRQLFLTINIFCWTKYTILLRALSLQKSKWPILCVHKKWGEWLWGGLPGLSWCLVPGPRKLMPPALHNDQPAPQENLRGIRGCPDCEMPQEEHHLSTAQIRQGMYIQCTKTYIYNYKYSVESLVFLQLCRFIVNLNIQ